MDVDYIPIQKLQKERPKRNVEEMNALQLARK